MSFGMVAASYLGTAGPPGNGSPYAGLVLAHFPLLYWRLNDTSGTTVTDSSAHGRQGTYIGSPALGGGSLLADSDGTSVHFDNGGNTRATLASAAWMNVSQMTVTCVYLCSYVDQINFQMIASRYASDGGDYSWWLYRENNEFKFGYKSVGGQVTVISSGVIEQHGQIYFIAAYCGTAGAGIRIYSLGTLLGSATGTAYALASSTGSFAVGGCDANVYKLTGIIQEVAYFDTILTVTDLDSLASQAIAPQPQWLNRTAGVAIRNGTNTHTLTFPATSAGSLLVAVVSGSVTSAATTVGWTKRLSPVLDCEYAVFTRNASAGDSALALLHNGSNYPINYCIYEFPAGSSWVAGAEVSDGAPPDLTGLPGASVTVFAGLGMSSQSIGDPTASALWGWRWFEDTDTMTMYDGVTEGIYMTLGWRRGVGGSSISPATEGFYGPVYTITNQFNARTSVTFALNIP